MARGKTWHMNMRVVYMFHQCLHSTHASNKQMQKCWLRNSWLADLHSFASKGPAGIDRREPLAFQGGGHRQTPWPTQGAGSGGSLAARAGPHMSAQVLHNCLKTTKKGINARKYRKEIDKRLRKKKKNSMQKQTTKLLTRKSHKCFSNFC